MDFIASSVIIYGFLAYGWTPKELSACKGRIANKLKQYVDFDRLAKGEIQKLHYDNTGDQNSGSPGLPQGLGALSVLADAAQFLGKRKTHCDNTDTIDQHKRRCNEAFQNVCGISAPLPPGRTLSGDLTRAVQGNINGDFDNMNQAIVDLVTSGVDLVTSGLDLVASDVDLALYSSDFDQIYRNGI